MHVYVCTHALAHAIVCVYMCVHIGLCVCAFMGVSASASALLTAYMGVSERPCICTVLCNMPMRVRALTMQLTQASMLVKLNYGAHLNERLLQRDLYHT